MIHGVRKPVLLYLAVNSLALSVLFSIPGLAEAAERPDPATATLDLDLTSLPYNPVMMRDYIWRRPEVGRGGPTHIWIDLDVDGYDETIYHWNHGLVCVAGAEPGGFRELWQVRLPAEYGWDHGRASLVGVPDLLGPGRPGVIVTCRQLDRDIWCTWYLDPEARELLGGVIVEAPEDQQYDDGKWDGNFAPVGALSIAGRDNAVAILVCDVGFDAVGRGLIAVDPLAGEICWRFTAGPHFTMRSTRIVDLDGDGRSEVVLSGGAVGNLHGEVIGFASDDTSRIMVVDNEGSLRWQRPLLPYSSGALLEVTDLEGDGSLEVVASASWGTEGVGYLGAWNAMGDLIAERHYDTILPSFTLLPRPETGGADILVQRYLDRIEVVQLQGNSFVPTRALDSPALVSSLTSVDILPDPGHEVVLAIHDQGLWILGRDLEPLARINKPLVRGNNTVHPWRLNDEKTYLVPFILERGLYRFDRVERSFSGFLRALPVLAIILLVALVIWRNTRPDTQADLAVQTELRGQLLDRLATADHGKIGALRVLRRLSWRLRGLVATGDDKSPLDDLLAEVRSHTLPALHDIIQLAARCGLPDHVVETAGEALSNLEAPLNNLAEEHSTELGTVADQLEPSVVEAEQSLVSLRRHTLATFTCDVTPVCARVLKAQARGLWLQVPAEVAELLPPGLSMGLELTKSRPDDPTTCCLDPRDLVFIMDNLVENAVRHMDGQSTPTLHLSWTVIGDQLLMTVADSGPGVEPEHRARLFEEGFSTADSSGLGLAKSRQILRRFGGDVALGEGQGSLGGAVFLVTLPLQDPGPPQKDGRI